ncbi:hypothetical protein PLAN_60303 [Planktothrix rubescens CCAP 1459/22]|uniref:Uncharacterized protein n=1 Tax=Planktothrix rubescens CCAP 1459/22 TaxID=329571 RepID=A0A6J7ZSG7_PLARU|nr:hypothetical protein PLAN_60303 [Planktothrix rubescens NIVA-CYA 18]
MGEPGTGVLEVQKLAIDGIWGFSEISNIEVAASIRTFLKAKSCSQ